MDRPISLPEKTWIRGTTAAVDVPNGIVKSRKKRPRADFSQFKMTFDRQYTLGSLLGSGAGSHVYDCVENRTGRQFAAKIVKPDSPSHRKRILKEVEILHICQEHPHVIDMKEYFEEQSRFYLIYQKMDGGPLLEHIARRKFFNEGEARVVTGEIGDALHFLHTKGIAHRDLKPANILCERVNAVTPVRVCDFDLGSAVPMATRVTTPELMTPVGSCEFMAPEVVAAFADDDLTYDKKCDMWSLGVILYIMLCGYPPFNGHCGESDCSWDSGGECYTCQSELLVNIRKGLFAFSGVEWSLVSDQAKDLICHLLVKDARDRYTADRMLAHPFLVEEMCSELPLATPSVLKRTNSGCSIEFFSVTAMSAVRCFHGSLSGHSEEPPSFQCVQQSSDSSYKISDDSSSRTSISSSRLSDSSDGSQMPLEEPTMSALAERRRKRREQLCLDLKPTHILPVDVTGPLSNMQL